MQADPSATLLKHLADGIEDARAGRTTSRGSFAQYLEDPERPSLLSFRAMDGIEDPDERRLAILDYLREVYDTAMSRSRTSKRKVGGTHSSDTVETTVSDPDGHTAIECIREAGVLLGIEPRKVRPKAGLLEVFGAPTPIRAAK